MKTEISKKQGRRSERSEEARGKGAKRAKQGKNSWGIGGGEHCKSPPQRGPNLKIWHFVKNAISL